MDDLEALFDEEAAVGEAASATAAEEDFEAIFSMMKQRFPAEELPDAKRQRVSGLPPKDGAIAGPRAAAGPAEASSTAEAPSAAEAAGAAPAPACASTALVATEDGDEPAEAPPERVVQALCLLDLPLDASARDVERQGRLLARSAHPDKVAPDVPPHLRGLADRRFRALQDAKNLVLAWLYGRPESPLGRGDTSSDEAGDDDSGDEDGEHIAELKACGLDPAEHDEWAEPPVVASATAGADEAAGSDEEVGAFDGGLAPTMGRGEADAGLRVADSSRGIIRMEDNVLTQATTLSAHMEVARAKAKKKTCQECLDKEAVEGKEVCKGCQKELDRLWRKIGGGGECT